MATEKKVKLTHDEIMELVDRTARRRLKITGAEFLERYKRGNLEDSPATRDILMLVRFGQKNKKVSPKSNSGVRRPSKLGLESDDNRKSADAA